MNRPVDLLVIGGGTAGIVAAKTAATLGARVGLVEADRPGGDCLWRGCVPSKTLIEIASRTGAFLGDMRSGGPAVFDQVRAAIAAIAPIDSPEALAAAGVQVMSGHAEFVGPDVVAVGDSTIGFRRAVLATGSAPAIPDAVALGADALMTRGIDLMTTDTVWDRTDIPSTLVVLGGGAIGCELGQAFARLGTQVTLVEPRPQLLTGFDSRAAQLVTAALHADGVRVLTDHRVVGFDGDTPASPRLMLTSSQATTSLEARHVLVAAGRTPRTSGIGLDRAGIDCNAVGFVTVDATLRTTNPRVWAAGDLTGHPALTHVAGSHASTAATNAVLGLRRRAATLIPRVVFTDPEVAAVGECDVRARGGLRALTVPHHDVDRAVTAARTDGFSTIVVDRRHRIVGALVVGPRAGETIGELALAVSTRCTTADLAATMHPYPTYNDGPWNAAVADVRGRLSTPAVASALRAVVAIRARSGRRGR
ncbi:NAD(P)/FAD-dependent oxidoreductase [Williamsia sp. CHRR-6]|uniref:dihydrolipoyl dehydrogenase family protein n=1 Tax=Williamsia sp. CHRR-6 TaxID=2835871 RepID=UPI001BD9A640|nr:FAD-dependent oxidoreductase [Williamsia sp. CHRR-6]MBT0566624.1 FAD-dependent oxidoreductase [Williamsia sp. CHRR-6]